MRDEVEEEGGMGRRGKEGKRGVAMFHHLGGESEPASPPETASSIHPTRSNHSDVDRGRNRFISWVCTTFNFKLDNSLVVVLVSVAREVCVERRRVSLTR